MQHELPCYDSVDILGLASKLKEKLLLLLLHTALNESSPGRGPYAVRMLQVRASSVVGRLAETRNATTKSTGRATAIITSHYITTHVTYGPGTLK